MVVSAKHVIYDGSNNNLNINFYHPLWDLMLVVFHNVRMLKNRIELMLLISFK